MTKWNQYKVNLLYNLVMTNISEILCIGNELLSGTVVNTNAQWISKRITNIGGLIKRSDRR